MKINHARLGLAKTEAGRAKITQDWNDRIQWCVCGAYGQLLTSMQCGACGKIPYGYSMERMMYVAIVEGPWESLPRFMEATELSKTGGYKVWNALVEAGILKPRFTLEVPSS